jgi:hypothetical protein
MSRKKITSAQPDWKTESKKKLLALENLILPPPAYLSACDFSFTFVKNISSWRTGPRGTAMI